MSFTYATLKTSIQDYMEDSGTTFTNNLDNFIKVTEEDILKNVELDYYKKNVTGTASSGNAYLGMPSDFLSAFSLAVISSSVYTYLLLKHPSFIRDYTPNASTTGTPKYYADFDNDTFILAPTPDADYSFELHYFYRPNSLTAGASDGTTYLSINAPNVLLSGCLLQAALFMKLDQTEVGTYKQNYDKEMMQFKVWAEGRNTKEEMRYDKTRSIL
mgnify:FL=1|jgi:hypothetical protein|tara:strand:+ start:378 stop:1022 length:645 start_codon:yes stop_codon:yes gene_type:complete